jgi:5'-3' exonuclease
MSFTESIVLKGHMGVKGLYTYLKPYRKEIGNPMKGPALRIGFDAMSMLYNYKSNYEDMYPLLKEFKAAGHRLLFVFDGKPPTEKEAEVKERRDARESACTQASNLKEYLTDATLSPTERKVLEYSLARLEFKGWHMTRDIRQTFQRALWDMEIPYVKALGEADDVLADMAVAGKLDVVVSTDMDFLLSGVSRLWIPLRNRYDGFEEILLKNVLAGEQLTLEGLRDVGILCGVESLRGLVSIASHMAFSWVRYYTSIEGILGSAINDPQLDILRNEPFLEKIRTHFKTGAWDARIRPDHLERFRLFIEAL